MNPFGLVPVLQDGEITLAESNAILVYLALRYGEPHWLPRDPLGAARVEHWLSVAAGPLAAGPARARIDVVFGKTRPTLSCSPAAMPCWRSSTRRWPGAPTSWARSRALPTLPATAMLPMHPKASSASTPMHICEPGSRESRHCRASSPCRPPPQPEPNDGDLSSRRAGDPAPRRLRQRGCTDWPALHSRHHAGAAPALLRATALRAARGARCTKAIHAQACSPARRASCACPTRGISTCMTTSWPAKAFQKPWRRGADRHARHRSPYPTAKPPQRDDRRRGGRHAEPGRSAELRQLSQVHPAAPCGMAARGGKRRPCNTRLGRRRRSHGGRSRHLLHRHRASGCGKACRGEPRWTSRTAAARPDSCASMGRR